MLAAGEAGAAREHTPASKVEPSSLRKRTTCCSASAKLCSCACIQSLRVRVRVAIRSIMVVTSCSLGDGSMVGFTQTSDGWAKDGVLADTIVAHPEEVYPS